LLSDGSTQSVYEYFTIAESITQISWWGVQGGSPRNDQFTVTYYTGSCLVGNLSVAQSFAVTATGQSTGNTVSDLPEMKWSVTHDEVPPGA